MSTKSVIEQVHIGEADLQPYYGLLDQESAMELERLARRLSGLKVAHLNATSMGGGVAEILRSLVPMMNAMGIDTKWFYITGDPEFFQVTKHIHNSLQGGAWQFDGRAHDVFLCTNRRIAEVLDALDVDLWIVHDPQPCPVSAGMRAFRQAIWHCHIDSSSPNRAVWNYFQRYLSGYDRLVFCLPEYVNGSVPREQVRFVRPAIDPLTVKNRPLTLEKAKATLSSLGLAPDRPLVTQVARFDPWKDPLGVIDAYRLAKQHIPRLQLALVGVIEAQDDPEAPAILAQVKRHAGADPDIHLFSDPQRVGQHEVNAFQTASSIVLQKSLREGFGLTVAEAMWKGNAVIGGDCGGIRIQIKNGVNGFLAASPQECANRIVQLLQDPTLKEHVGRSARESTRTQFLITRFLTDYLQLIEEVVLGGR